MTGLPSRRCRRHGCRSDPPAPAPRSHVPSPVPGDGARSPRYSHAGRSRRCRWR
jgi:hypothetical protein